MKIISELLLLLAAACPATIANTTLSVTSGSVPKPDFTLNADSLDLSRLIRVNTFRLEIIPPSTGVQFYKNGIVFLSDSKAETNMPENHTSFGTVEAYYATFSDTTLGYHFVFSPSVVWEVPCESMTFNGDYSTMYFAKKPSPKESEKIFQAKFITGKKGRHDWISDDKPLSFCSGKAAYTHPALSPDGGKMVFASNNSDSKGGMDLFITTTDGGSWSAPANLGENINTPGNEMYPFIDQENNLYFSSDGMNGFGGYDIYFCKYDGKEWGKPVNLSKNINTADNDMAFTISRTDRRSAFFTRQVKTGIKPVALFKVTLIDMYVTGKLSTLTEVFSNMASVRKPVEEINPSKPVAKNEIPRSDKDIQPAITGKKSVPEKASPASGKQAAPPAKNKPATPVAQEKKPEPAVKEAPKPQVAKQTTASEGIVYRVQFASGSKSKGNYEITAGGKPYKTYEYLYNGAYRSCAGEFSSPSQASAFQKVMKLEGYKDAFVVVFVNNVRSLDPSLMKK